MAIVDFIPITTYVAGIPLGAATAIASAKIASQYGHRFMQHGYHSPYLIGVIGLVQNLFATILYINWLAKGDEKDLYKKMFCSHLIVGGALLGLTILATRVNLTAASLTALGAVLLAATGFMGTSLTLATSKWAVEELKKD